MSFWFSLAINIATTLHTTLVQISYVYLETTLSRSNIHKVGITSLPPLSNRHKNPPPPTPHDLTWNNTWLKRKGSYFVTIARMKLVINKCTLREMDCSSTTWNPPNTEETTVKATEWTSLHPSESVYDILLCPVLISQWHTPKKCQQFVHKSCPVSTFCSIVSDKWWCDGTSEAQVIIPPKRFSDQVRLLWIVNNCNILAVLIPIVLCCT